MAVVEQAKIQEGSPLKIRKVAILQNGAVKLLFGWEAQGPFFEFFETIFTNT